MVSGHGQSTADSGLPTFEAAHVIALPAVQGDGDGCQRPYGGEGVDSDGRVLFACEFERLHAFMGADLYY
jgi:hypothetical protein